MSHDCCKDVIYGRRVPSSSLSYQLTHFLDIFFGKWWLGNCESERDGIAHPSWEAAARVSMHSNFGMLASMKLCNYRMYTYIATCIGLLTQNIGHYTRMCIISS